MTSQPDHTLADEPMADEQLPDDFGPTAIVTPEPLPADPLPEPPRASEEVAGSPRPSFDPGQAGATADRRVGNGLPEPVVIGRHAERTDSTTVSDDTMPDDTVLDDTALDDTALDDTALDDTALDDTEADDNVLDDTGSGDTGLGMRTTAASVAPGRLSGQWHDIQALFVDDPQGSVQRAAQVVDSAVIALAESLRQRQDALVPADTSNALRNTEQLREALVGFRDFYERLAALAEQLATG